MRAMTLAELQEPLQGKLLGEDVSFSVVFTDSRHPADRGLFVALVGENFDGNDYVAAVADRGAAAALVSRPTGTALPQLCVRDTTAALGRLGAFNRSEYTGPLVAITGSCGKTTAKNLVHSVLAQRGNAFATAGNLNNEIGVPLTLLQIDATTEFAVVEMGAGKPGDIALLCELGRPTVSVLLNVMPAHLEGMGSLQGVAQTKGEIFDGLGADDVAIMNADEPWVSSWRARAGDARVIDFSLRGEAAVRATRIESHGVNGTLFEAQTPEGEISVMLPLPGVHNVANALAATAVGLACGLSLAEITAGLESVAPVAGRLALVRGAAGAQLIDDCYNANPGSAHAAIDTLAASAGRRTLIMGAMRELGSDSAAMHRELGVYAREAGLDQFWGVGDALRDAVVAFGDSGRWFADTEAACIAAGEQFGEGDTVLIKGSRGARMERVLQALAQSAEGED
ncbi:UDP-N-acetylmuramoyl-tripeptide--D-alanyl-D-alanine ligase [Pseudohalioglobus lutimaris]|uniref:UDP-N-acetylmuramoyl-tripeptide--D-alanyl-D-alanine ligase n=1 Tax=Pseudohalioglobus lutimaris TaxID=1737061 RepID=A0A2N5X7C0_9GAMM|nr:UDP-N-acetylmuramoyl-tripeptide--D-alanyl-D-alanine ligase [Pseudohalioglobus lutimaris]PLW70379.1 UDP-N-acetylmuramoyl-tripeptide--D-alanyl-D-alanine ligase [Pseudohalioglobus lutimaris]